MATASLRPSRAPDHADGPVRFPACLSLDRRDEAPRDPVRALMVAIAARSSCYRAKGTPAADLVADELAGNLSGGQKKLLELGRTMMVDAKVVFLAEVGAGVNRTLLNSIGDAIVRLNKERGYTFCMVEHDMDFIGRLCDPVIVMAEGKVLTVGPPTEVMKNEAVIEAYLGRDDEDL